MKDTEGTFFMLERGVEETRKPSGPVGRVVELFAGVGGFRLGLEGVPLRFRRQVHESVGYDPRGGRWQVVWGNQWEPTTKTQHAWECYARNFDVGPEEREQGNCDIALVPADCIPDHELLVGGFPCQDYSVAKPLNQAHGIQGKKGVLWWEIHRILETKRPPWVLLENVDRLLKSPARQRGRDFAIILATMSDLGYEVEWRVVNAADYGFAQRRRRVFIVGRMQHRPESGPEVLRAAGVLPRALPAVTDGNGLASLKIEGDAFEVSQHFGIGLNSSPFQSAGFMRDREVWTCAAAPLPSEPAVPLARVLLPDEAVPQRFFIDPERIDTWRYLKGAKREKRYHKASSVPYWYSEGALPFPDPVDRPARTILTGEGGSGPSRFKHVVQCDDGRFRRLTPIELERLNGFPDDWTEGMSDVRRAFCMGNALVVGVVRRIGDVMAQDAESS